MTICIFLATTKRYCSIFPLRILFFCSVVLCSINTAWKPNGREERAINSFPLMACFYDWTNKVDVCCKIKTMMNAIKEMLLHIESRLQ